jgi:hypothetical protein
VSAGFCPLSLYLILLPFFWGHMHWPFWSLLIWGALAHVSMGGIFDVAEKTDHITQSVHQHGQLPYDDATEEDDHQRQPCEIAHCAQKIFHPGTCCLRKGVNFLGIFAKWMLTELACLNIILIDVSKGARVELSAISFAS